MSEIIGIKIGDEIIDTQTAQERGLDGEKILFDNCSNLDLFSAFGKLFCSSENVD